MKINENSIKAITKPMSMVTVGTVFRNDPLDSVLSGTALGEDVIPEGGTGGDEPTGTPEEIAAAKAQEATKVQEAEAKAKQDAIDAERFAGKTDEEITAMKAEDEAKRLAEAEGGNGDDEFAEIKTTLLEKYKGTSYDGEGNILDAEGNIIKKFEEFESELSNEVVPVVQELSTMLGYELKDENGKPREYEDSTKGLGQYVNDVSSVIAEKQIDEFLDAYSDVKDFFNHLELGGTREDFFNSATSFEDVEIKKDNIALQKQVVSEALKAKGFSDEKAADFVTMLETGGKLFDESITSQKELNEIGKAATAERNRQIEQKRVTAQDNAKKHWDNVKSTIDNGTLKDIKIPQADVQDFYSYISLDVDGKGNSRDMIDASKEDLETRLMMSYYRYKGYTLTDMVKAMSGEQRVASIRDRFTQSQKQVGEHKKPEAPYVNPNEVDISLDNMLP